MSTGQMTKAVIGNPVIASGPDPRDTYEFRYRVVDLDDLQPSHHANLLPNPNFPKELQPRQRGREASRQQISRIASKLQPDALIDDFRTLDRGPMIIGPDNVVESGNGRTIALLLARQEFPGRYRAYQDAVRARAVEFGITDIGDIDDPVLVRERLSNVNRVQFAGLANQAAVLTMSPVEQAMQDAEGLSQQSLATLQINENQSIDQALRSPTNRPLLSTFLSRMSDNERAALLDSQGNLNQTGLQRIKAAIFAKVFPGDEGHRLTTTFFESVDPQIKTIESSLFDVLPALAKAEGLTKTGQRASDLSVGEDLAKAVDMLARLKQENITVEEYLGQAGLFERELTPTQEQLLAFFATNARSRKRVREGLKEYTIAVEAAPHPDQSSFFADAVERKEEILGRIFKQQQLESSGETIGLFALAAEREKAGFDRPPIIKETTPIRADSEALEPVSLAPTQTMKELNQSRRREHEDEAAQIQMEQRDKLNAQLAQWDLKVTPQSQRGLDMDIARTANTVADLDDPSPANKKLLEKWAKRPNRYDVLGVDAPLPIQRRPRRRAPFRSR